MSQAAAVTDIAHTIQTAVAPVFLLAGIGAFLNVLTGRLARCVDRARHIEKEFTPLDHLGHERQVVELRVLDLRIMLANSAIFLCTSSAIAVCLTVAGLFVSNFTSVGGARAITVAFVVAMGLLVCGLVLFLMEVRVAADSIRVRDELLERQRRRRRWR